MSDTEGLLARFERGTFVSLDIGDGWLPLVIELDRAIAEIHPTYTLHQVKEKFGGLRYYIGGVPTDRFDQVHALISDAEARSYTICEVCGGEGEPRSGGWVRTLCDEHEAARP